MDPMPVPDIFPSLSDVEQMHGDTYGLKDRNPAFEYDDVVIDGAHIESLSDHAELPNLIMQLHQNQLTINSESRNQHQQVARLGHLDNIFSHPRPSLAPLDLEHSLESSSSSTLRRKECAPEFKTLADYVIPRKKFWACKKTDLDKVKESWTSHWIRKSRNATVSSILDMMYFLYKEFGQNDCLIPVSSDKLIDIDIYIYIYWSREN
ncbi:unnamed protein product [Porites evermanni]|uniref:Uncharacterized protein n=1 Tax=Porites evermanni TaxID=104178 RepID=A0ABN8RUX2_9CNID|nr:unnamed protein product [Porites evermanni]